MPAKINASDPFKYCNASNIGGYFCPLHEITWRLIGGGKIKWFEITSGLYFNLWSQAVVTWMCVAWGHFSKPHSSCPWKQNFEHNVLNNMSFRGKMEKFQSRENIDSFVTKIW